MWGGGGSQLVFKLKLASTRTWATPRREAITLAPSSRRFGDSEILREVLFLTRAQGDSQGPSQLEGLSALPLLRGRVLTPSLLARVTVCPARLGD